jgi:hypothetical protein
MTIHAGKDSIPSGLLSDHIRWVQHPAPLSRHLRTARFGKDVSRSDLPQGTRKLIGTPKGCIPFILTLYEMVDVLGSIVCAVRGPPD